MNITKFSANTTSFQARPASVQYKMIKSIPNIPCACCGEKMIVSKQIGKVFRAISKPFATVLKSGVLDQWKNADFIWEVLQKFAKADPRKTLFSILQNKQTYSELNHAIRAEHKRTQNFTSVKNDISNIINASTSNLRSSGVVMKKAAKLKSYLDGVNLEVFEQLEIYSRKYPRKSLAEIVKADEVFKYHEAKNRLQKQETEEQINFRFENIQKIIHKTIKQPQEFFDKLQLKAMEIYTSTQDPVIRNAKIKKLYGKMLTKHKSEKLLPEVNKEIDQIPISYMTKDAFFVEAYRKNFNDKKILSSILSPYKSSFEHIVPSSKNGKDKTKNGLVMHQKCNSYRGNMSYREFFKYHPNMLENISKQVNYIARSIINGSLSEEFRFWPMGVAKTLKCHTRGEVNINLTRHCKKGIAEAEKRIKAREDNIIQLNQDREQLQRQIAELKSELDNITNNVNHLNKENNKEKPLIDSYEAHIKYHAKQRKIKK